MRETVVLSLACRLCSGPKRGSSGPAISSALSVWNRRADSIGPGFGSHAQQTPQTTPTIRVTSRLVFLDVTVLDKKGRPSVSGLTKDDFTITEDKRPQAIFSFE